MIGSVRYKKRALVDVLGGKMREHNTSYYLPPFTSGDAYISPLVKVKSSFTPECLASFTC